MRYLRANNWKQFLIASILIGVLLFPISATSSAIAVDASPSPSPSASASPSTSASASPEASASPTPSTGPSVSPTPNETPSPTPMLYDIDSAKSVSVVVNKKRPLTPVDYLPVGKVKIGYVWVAKPVAEAYERMRAEVAAKKLGNLCVNSGYRSFASQKIIHAMQVGRQGKNAGEKLAARPGYSEHQTALAIDISTTQLGCRIGSFGASKASNWISSNAHRFGFIVRYPSNAKTAITGYVWEPWHLRYVGRDLATEMRAKKITTLEEFFALPSAAKY